MLWAVWCIDNEGIAETRAQHSKQHSAHLNGSPIRLVIAGPLKSDDGEANIGSLLVYEADTRQEVEDFIAADPFNKAGIWRSADIRAFHMSRNNSNNG